MELTIKGTPKEIADLVVQVQGRQSNLAFSPAVIGRIPKDFPRENPETLSRSMQIAGILIMFPPEFGRNCASTQYRNTFYHLQFLCVLVAVLLEQDQAS